MIIDILKTAWAKAQLIMMRGGDRPKEQEPGRKTQRSTNLDSLAGGYPIFIL